MAKETKDNLPLWGIFILGAIVVFGMQGTEPVQEITPGVDLCSVVDASY